MPVDAVARQAVSAFDAVLHVERDSAGRRRLAALGGFALDRRGRLVIQEKE
jgi:pilus assembly protein CpaF